MDFGITTCKPLPCMPWALAEDSHGVHGPLQTSKAWTRFSELLTSSCQLLFDSLLVVWGFRFLRARGRCVAGTVLPLLGRATFLISSLQPSCPPESPLLDSLGLFPPFAPRSSSEASVPSGPSALSGIGSEGIWPRMLEHFDSNPFPLMLTLTSPQYSVAPVSPQTRALVLQRLYAG